MSVEASNREAKWIWFDGNTWQSYDDETNSQIESAYMNGIDSVALTQGSHFGKFQNVYRVYFNYTTHPPSFNQVNIVTKDMIQIRRTLVFKPQTQNIMVVTPTPHELTKLDGNNNNNHQNTKKIKKKKKKSKRSKSKTSTKSTNKSSASRASSFSHSTSSSFSLSVTPSSSSSSLLSAIKRIQVYKCLYNAGFNKQSIDEAIKRFNHKFNAHSPILQDIKQIVNELTDIIHFNATNNPNHQSLKNGHSVHHSVNSIHTTSSPQQSTSSGDEEQGSHSSKGSNYNGNGHAMNGVNGHHQIHHSDDTIEETKECAPCKPSERGLNGYNNHKRNGSMNGVNGNVFDFRIGAWIEVNINNNWIPGKIIDINWSSKNTVITIGYQDIFNKRSKQIKLNGAEINRNKCRPISNMDDIRDNLPDLRDMRDLRDTPTPRKRGRFDFDDHDTSNRGNGVRTGYGDRRSSLSSNGHGHGSNGHHRNGSANGSLSSSSRFNRNNLSINKFNFEYHKDNKKYDEKNAKHPSEYINRKCFKCKGSGKCAVNVNNNNDENGDNVPCLRCKSTGYAQLACTKCINASGIYRKAFSLMHSKCGGQGCSRCNNKGKYPLHDILCNNCKGTGSYKVKCSVCNAEKLKPQRDLRDLRDLNIISQQRYNSCISGYRLPQLIPFVPKRKNSSLQVHGADMKGRDLKGMHNMKRLYHATDANGADGIIETGLIELPNKNGDRRGIYFTDNGRSAELRAKELGYLVIADVFVGKTKNEYNQDSLKGMSFNKLHSMGFDSICGHWNRNQIGNQYVIYHWDQVWVHVVLPVDHVNFQQLK